MRFDDSLNTVLAADTASGFGAQAAWRQLVDLIGRGRVGDVETEVARLSALKSQVPAPVRAASARALAMARPPVALVGMFAADDLAIAAPLLRTAQLSGEDWRTLLPRLTPAGRSVLRQRRDLPVEVVRALESFGATDFVLADTRPFVAATPPVTQEVAAPLGETSFVAVGQVAREIPVVAEALKHAAELPPRFEIADLVARIDAFQRDRAADPIPAPSLQDDTDRFRFATDADGLVRWVDGFARGPLIGVSLAHGWRQGAAKVDDRVGDALRRRTTFRDARLEIAGSSAAAGLWRVAGEPVFDRASGRFQGMSGIARRSADVLPGASAPDQLRQLVHELRTPANAIAGFAELIDSELLGHVPPVYRERAALIQRQAGDLIAAIEDLDTAARLEGGALDLRPTTVDMAELVRRAAEELVPRLVERGAVLSVNADGPAYAEADDRTAQRLVTRLLATLVSVAQPGERLRAHVTPKTRNVRLAISRPRALANAAGKALLAIDAEPDREGGPLLGTGFTLRLLRDLASALGGRLEVEDDRLILRLPTSLAEIEQPVG